MLATIGKPIPKINFPLPWAVKPILEGSSIGISKVNHSNELKQALELAWQYDQQALIEYWITGDEYTVSILNQATLPVIKLLQLGAFIIISPNTIQIKLSIYAHATSQRVANNSYKKIALNGFNLLGAKTWGRVDFIVDKQQKPYLLEINTVPGMTSHSLLPMAAKAVGLNFDQLVLTILNEQ